MTDTANTTSSTVSRLESIREALDTGTLRSIRRMMHSLHPAEIARLLESLRPAEREVVWELVDPEDDGEVLLHVNDEVRMGLIRGMDAQELLAATEDLDIDDLADLFADLPEAVTQQLLRSMDEQNRNRLAGLLAYPEDSAGGLMNTDTVTVRPDVTVDVVLRYLRMREDLPEDTDRLFVVNRYGRLLGTLTLARLLSSDTATTVAEIMDTEIKGIPAETSAQEVASLFEDRDLVSAPVVDAEGVLLGRITIDDVVDVIRDQADHSFMTMAGLTEDEDMFAPVLLSARRRALWLGVNMFTATIAAAVVGLFEATLDKIVALAVLMPIVASMGGIAGSQVLTIMIRGLALGQLDGSNARWFMGKQLAVIALNSIGLSAIVAGIAWLWFRSIPIAAIIGSALIINLLIAALAGCTVPLLLRRLGIDPALAGPVVLTTFTDVMGFLVFLGLGTLYLL
ncbi:MAG TPA: magnesium transporter [Gammaproteobacteria bacterium]|nr:magnesium transporter [Gammaproteobacteria bacterium]